MRGLKLCIGTALAALALTTSGVAGAQGAAYPDKAIKVIVPFGAGSLTDILGRIFASNLNTMFKVPVVVENRPGAGGNLGAGMVVRSEPDGYTILMGAASTNAINPSLYKDMGFNPINDFAPIAEFASVANVLVVPPAIKANTLEQFIGQLKSGANYAYASGGAGGSQHLSAELLLASTHTKMLHIPYKGGSEPLPDLISNRVQAMFCNLPVCLPMIRAGQLVPLGISTTTRSSLLPDVPTIAESGYPSYEVKGWYGVFVPKGTPEAVQDKLHAAVEQMLSDPDTKKKIQAAGAEPKLSSRREFAAFVGAEYVKWKKVIEDAHISIN